MERGSKDHVTLFSTILVRPLLCTLLSLLRQPENSTVHTTWTQGENTNKSPITGKQNQIHKHNGVWPVWKREVIETPTAPTAASLRLVVRGCSRGGPLAKHAKGLGRYLVLRQTKPLLRESTAREYTKTGATHRTGCVIKRLE